MDCEADSRSEYEFQASVTRTLSQTVAIAGTRTVQHMLGCILTSVNYSRRKLTPSGTF